MTGVSECSQQRGNLKDNGYIFILRIITNISISKLTKKKYY
ncbi:hypothetical protein [Photorhabdus sp. RW14-46]|nr:hypothetical protein [Photorhabdus sp. RW14-46]